MKTFRVRKCGVKLYMPGNVIYTCQLEKHTPETMHTEVGFVIMPNGTARRYTIHWKDEGVAAIRQTKIKKVRHIK